MGDDARTFKQSDVYIHNETTIYGLQWPQDAAFSDNTSLADEPARLIARRPAPASVQASAQSTTQSMVLQNGDTVKITTTSASTDELVEVDNESGSTTDTKHYRQNPDNTWAIADEMTGAILGSADDMVAIDNKNNDNIVVKLGNYKFDTLEVDAANGVNLKTSTVQVQALGSGSAVVLTGTSNKPLSSYKWVASDGTTYVFSRAAYADAAAGIGSLTVTSGAMGSAGQQLIIKNFDLNQAETSPNGYLGIKFGEQVALQSGATSTDAFATSPTSTPTLGLSKDSAATFTVDASADESAVQSVTLTLNGGDASDFAVSTGTNLLNFNGNTLTVSIPTGEDSATFSLVDIKDPGAAQSVSLTASLQSDDSPASDGSTLDFNFSEAAKTSAPTNSVTGTLDTSTGITKYQSTGGLTDDVVEAGNGPNRIATYGGNDSIVSGTGNDQILVLDGNDSIAGGGGKDEIVAGKGDDAIYALKSTDLATAIENGQQGTATGQQGALIGTGDGNSVIVGGDGNDFIQVGQGNNVIVAGPGNDVIMAGNATETWSAKFDWGETVNTSGEDWSAETDGLSVGDANYVAPPRYEGNYNASETADLPVGIGDDTIYGGKGDSLFLLSNGDNYVDAGGGSDAISGGMGSDTIFGSTGSVTVLGGGGDTYIDGESGNDFLVGQGGDNTIYGGSGTDTIFAGDDNFWAANEGSTWDKAETGDNYVDGGSGDDLIYGSGGNDTLIAGSGNSTVYGGSGNEMLEGGSGQSVLVSGSASAVSDGAGTTVLSAGDGDNTLIGGAGDDTLYGGDGTDLLQSGSGDQTIYTGDGGTDEAPTKVLLGSGQSTVYGGDGVAQVEGASGADTMIAGTGDTTLQGGSATDLLYGGDGDDVLTATSGNDTMHAGAGDTTMRGGSGLVTMYGGDGTDEMIAGSGDATLIAGDGDTSMQGGSGNATMQGGAGSDTMFGGAGSTLMEAGEGLTTMVGGSGQDTFAIGADAGGVVIGNFGLGDVLELGSGVSISDLQIVNGMSDDGDYSGLDIELSGGGSVLLDEGTYSLSDQVVLADGGSYTVGQLINSTNSQTSLRMADGSIGTQIVIPQSQGHANTIDYNAQDEQIGTGVAADDGHGNSTLTSYNSSNVETSSSYAHSDGSTGTTFFEAGGGSYGTQRNSNGTSSTSTDDGHGDTTTLSFDAAGNKTGSTDISADGSSVADTYAADGSYVELATDVAGDTTTTRFASDGTELGDAWTKVDGTSGSDTFNADGSIVRVGTDAQGTTTTTNIDVSGAETSSSFVQANGTRGVELFNADGSTLTTVTHPDGTATRTTDDGAGDTTVTQVDATGHASSDTWVRSDESHGTDTFQANGSSSGTSHNADGTTSQYVDDGAGDRTTTLLDSNGNEKSDAWTKADGSHGTDTVNSDGSVSHLSISPEGKISYSVTDTQGNVISSGGSGDGVDSSQQGALAQEAAFAAKLSQYLVSNPSASYANYRDAAKSLDLVFMMTYDHYGAWTKGTGNHTAPRASADGAEDGLDVAIKTMTGAGVPADKLVAGVAMYGRGFTGVAAPAPGKGFSGAPHTGTYPAPEGASDYRELAARYLDRHGRGLHGYQAIFDPRTHAWNLYNARNALFMGYDDPRAVIEKGRLARETGLAGVFAWELSQDDGDILNAMNFGVGNVPLQP